MDTQTKESTTKKAEVMKDLERVEPVVIDAPNAMKSIKKQYLVEVRSVANPPPLIKRALESACILWGASSPIDWKGTRDVPFRQELMALGRPQSSRRARRRPSACRS